MVASVGLAAVKHVKDGHHASGVISIVQNAPVAHAPGPRSTVAEQKTARSGGEERQDPLRRHPVRDRLSTTHPYSHLDARPEPVENRHEPVNGEPFEIRITDS